MKFNVVYAALGAAAILFAGCDKKADLSSDKAKYSYAIGHQIGKNIKAQNIDIDAKAFAYALNQVTKGETPAMNDDQMRDAMKKMSDMAQEKAKADAEKNKKAGDEYLAANAKKEGVKTTASGLQYKVVSEGKGAKPKPDDTVQVHYKGTLIDGSEFDSSYKRGQPAEFPVKAVIPGWTEALQLMTVGSKYQLFIPASLAYGERGNPAIPGNSVLLFDVELLGIKAPEKGKKK